MWRSSLMCLPDTSWGGGSHRLWKRHSCWMRWSRRCGPVVRLAPSITAIKALSQYVSLAYTERLKEAKLLASTGSTGDSYDNAMAESINGLYKAEVIHRKSWKNRAEVELATLTWGTGITIDNCWEGWAILLRQKQKKLIMLPSETMIWQSEFTDKTLSRKPGAVQIFEVLNKS